MRTVWEERSEVNALVRAGDVHSLQRAAVFRGLEAEDLETLAAIAACRRYMRGDVICLQGESDDTLFVLVRGGIRLLLLGPLGQELTLLRRRSGDVFELGTVDAVWPDDTVAEVLVDGTLIYALPWHPFLELVAARPRAVASLAALLRTRRAEEHALLRELAFYTMKARLAHRLADLASASTGWVVSETREALAGMIGSRAEEVTRALHQLRDEGLVDFRPHCHRRIAVLDQARLGSYGKGS